MVYSSEQIFVIIYRKLLWLFNSIVMRHFLNVLIIYTLAVEPLESGTARVGYRVWYTQTEPELFKPEPVANPM